MKHFSFLIIAFLLTFISCTDKPSAVVESKVSTELRTTDCGPDLQAPGCWEVETVTGFSVTYFGCEIPVTYKIRRCFGGLAATVDVWDVEFDYYDCDSLVNHFAEIIEADDYNLLNDEYNLLYQEVVRQIESTAIVSLTQILYVGCDDDINKHYQVTYHDGNCISQCYSYTEEGLPYIRTVNCGYQCCQSTTKYCMDGDVLVAGATSMTSTGSCEPFFRPKCEASPINGGRCNSPCERLDFER